MLKTMLLTTLTTLFLPLSAGQPTAEEALANYIEAMGGAKKLAGATSLKMTGLYVYNGIEHPLIIQRKRSNKLRYDITGLNRFGTSFAKGKTVVRSYDGKQAWGIGESPNNPNGASLMPKASAAMMKHHAYFFSPLTDATKNGDALILQGADKVDGFAVWVLEITLADGGKQHWFLDQKTWLPRKMLVPGGGDRFTPNSVVFDDWRSVEGVQIPHYQFLEEGIFSREYIIEAVTLNASIDDTIFTKPAS